MFHVYPFSGEQLTKSFTTDVNRFNKVPAINDNGFKLSESVAIFHYLGRKGIIPERWYPKDIKTLTRVDEYLEWNHNNISLSAGTLFYLQVLQPTKTGVPPSAERIEQQKRTLTKALDDLEHLWLKDNKFLIGNDITFCDLIAVSMLEQVIGLNLFKLDEHRHAKVNKWLDEVRKYFGATYKQAHIYVYKFGEKIKETMK